MSLIIFIVSSVFKIIQYLIEERSILWEGTLGFKTFETVRVFLSLYEKRDSAISSIFGRNIIFEKNLNTNVKNLVWHENLYF